MEYLEQLPKEYIERYLLSKNIKKENKKWKIFMKNLFLIKKNWL